MEFGLKTLERESDGWLPIEAAQREPPRFAELYEQNCDRVNARSIRGGVSRYATYFFNARKSEIAVPGATRQARLDPKVERALLLPGGLSAGGRR